MKISIHNSQGKPLWSLNLHNWARLALSMCLLGVPLTAGAMHGFELAGGRLGLYIDDSIEALKKGQKKQQTEQEHSHKIEKNLTLASNLKPIEMSGRQLLRFSLIEDNLFNDSDQVTQGQRLVRTGRTGQIATNQHVLFEVYKHGRSVDPASYIRRNIR